MRRTAVIGNSRVLVFFKNGSAEDFYNYYYY